MLIEIFENPSLLSSGKERPRSPAEPQLDDLKDLAKQQVATKNLL